MTDLGLKKGRRQVKKFLTVNTPMAYVYLPFLARNERWVAGKEGCVAEKEEYMAGKECWVAGKGMNA